MVSEKELRELQSEIADALDEVKKAKNAEQRQGEDVTVRHPITGEMISVGKFGQDDVNSARSQAQSRAQNVKSKADGIDFSTLDLND